jgi:ketosteroid isomerase-like protein
LVLLGCIFLAACSSTSKEPQVEDAPEVQAEISALREAYAAFNRGDIEAALQPFEAQIEWTEPPEFARGGTWHGREGVRRYLAQSRASFAEGSSEPERFITAGDRIVVFVHAHIRPVGSNEWQDVRLADVYTMRNGKAIQMRAFADRQQALRWVGVEDPIH